MPKNLSHAEWTGKVLDFWLGHLSPEAWFKKDAATDAIIRNRFGDLYGEVSTALPLEATESARGSLAAVIVLDQFPRNIFRDSPKAFLTYRNALELAQSAIDRGLDKDLPAEQRQFLYMPFQHSEDREVQLQSVELFAGLDDADALEYARRHLEIIDRFGRFPHRNAALGRTSTPEEVDFLREPDSSF